MILTAKGKKISVLVVLTVLGGLFFGLRSWLQAPRPGQEYVPPSVHMEESRIVGRHEGEKQWEIPTARVLQEGEEIILTELGEIVIFQEGEPYLYLDAETAVWERQSDLLDLMGAVQVTGPEGFRLESDHLLWRGADKKLTSPGPVRIEWDDLAVKSNWMVFKTEEEAVFLEDDVQIEQGGLLWKTEQAIYYLQEKILEFKGKLVLESKEVFGDGQK